MVGGRPMPDDIKNTLERLQESIKGLSDASALIEAANQERDRDVGSGGVGISRSPSLHGCSGETDEGGDSEGFSAGGSSTASSVIPRLHL
ncbi:unnamed protein product, partial [Choristocarpus tenellus]